ncbi:MAG: hypothetical protein EA399_06890 [Desulfovibrionales bacterium]|nr:MAG: hypothetical protein EA399_06890 [Desulfovibrionales bacterium]
MNHPNYFYLEQTMIGRCATLVVYRELFVLRDFQIYLAGGALALAGYLWEIFGPALGWPALVLYAEAKWSALHRKPESGLAKTGHVLGIHRAHGKVHGQSLGRQPPRHAGQSGNPFFRQPPATGHKAESGKPGRQGQSPAPLQFRLFRHGMRNNIHGMMAGLGIKRAIFGAASCFGAGDRGKMQLTEKNRSFKSWAAPSHSSTARPCTMPTRTRSSSSPRRKGLAMT